MEISHSSHRRSLHGPLDGHHLRRRAADHRDYLIASVSSQFRIANQTAMQHSTEAISQRADETGAAGDQESLAHANLSS